MNTNKNQSQAPVIPNVEASDLYEKLYFCSNMGVDTLALPLGKIATLKSLEINTLGDLVDFLPQLRKIWGFGPKTLASIYNELIEHSIAFGALVSKHKIPVKDFATHGVCSTSSIEEFADYTCLLRRDHLVLA